MIPQSTTPQDYTRMYQVSINGKYSHDQMWLSLRNLYDVSLKGVEPPTTPLKIRKASKEITFTPILQEEEALSSSDYIGKYAKNVKRKNSKYMTRIHRRGIDYALYAIDTLQGAILHCNLIDCMHSRYTDTIPLADWQFLIAEHGYERLCSMIAVGQLDPLMEIGNDD